MFCSQCGTRAEDGARFCNACGAPLQASGGVVHQAPQSYEPYSEPAPKTSRRSGSAKSQDPYALQIKQLKLQLKQLKLDLKQLNTQMSSIRANYNQTNAFVPHGFLHEADKMIEDARLRGPQHQKEALQQQIMQLEQELLSLEQQQQQWQQG